MTGAISQMFHELMSAHTGELIDQHLYLPLDLMLTRLNENLQRIDHAFGLQASSGDQPVRVAVAGGLLADKQGQKLVSYEDFRRVAAGLLYARASGLGPDGPVRLDFWNLKDGRDIVQPTADSDLSAQYDVVILSGLPALDVNIGSLNVYGASVSTVPGVGPLSTSPSHNQAAFQAMIDRVGASVVIGTDEHAMMTAASIIDPNFYAAVPGSGRGAQGVEWLAQNVDFAVRFDHVTNRQAAMKAASTDVARLLANKI